MDDGAVVDNAIQSELSDLEGRTLEGTVPAQ